MRLIAQSLSHFFKCNPQVAFVAFRTHPSCGTPNDFQLIFAKPEELMCVAGRAHDPDPHLLAFYIPNPPNPAVRNFDTITILHAGKIHHEEPGATIGLARDSGRSITVSGGSHKGGEWFNQMRLELPVIRLSYVKRLARDMKAIRAPPRIDKSIRRR